jgi:hypothetical protein
MGEVSLTDTLGPPVKRVVSKQSQRNHPLFVISYFVSPWIVHISKIRTEFVLSLLIVLRLAPQKAGRKTSHDLLGICFVIVVVDFFFFFASSQKSKEKKITMKKKRKERREEVLMI